MADLREAPWRPVLRVVALAWLLVIAPVELATALATLITGPRAMPGAAVVSLVVCRVVVVTAGLMLGRHLLRPDEDTRLFARVWACADLGTLAAVLASDGLPTNRRPGDAPLVWLVYAAAALAVVVASSLSPSGGGRARRTVP
jgi:hypothetical protein